MYTNSLDPVKRNYTMILAWGVRYRFAVNRVLTGNIDKDRTRS